MADQKNIVVLGASFSGLSAAHSLLKHSLPALPNNGAGYHVTLVNPSANWFTRPAAPRAVVSDSLLPDSKTFLPIAKGFEGYKDKFSFVLGSATSMDASARTVVVSTKEGEKVLSYYALIIATGTRTYSPILGLTTNEEDLHTALGAFRKQLPSATSIVIGGAGPAGVETAGEIGEFLNGAAGFFASRPKTIKTKITLVSGAEKMLPILRPALSKKAEKFLNRVGVDVIYGQRVERVSPEGAGSTVESFTTAQEGKKVSVTLSGGETLEADIYIPATGVKPNTDFMDPKLLNEKRYVDNNKTTLRVDAAGPRVYAVGDVGSYTRGGVMDIYATIPVLMTNVKRDLLYDSMAVGDAEKGGKAEMKGQDRPYKENLAETQLVPVGRSKGVGAVFGWKLPSLMVWMIKGRDYFTSMAPPIQNGSKWNKESKWKGEAVA